MVWSTQAREASWRVVGWGYHVTYVVRMRRKSLNGRCGVSPLAFSTPHHHTTPHIITSELAMSLLFRPLRAAARTVSASVPAAVRFSSTKRLSIPEPRGEFHARPCRAVTARLSTTCAGGIDSAPKFIEAISTPRRDLSSAPDEWNALFLANSGTLKTAGMSVKDRR